MSSEQKAWSKPPDYSSRKEAVVCQDAEDESPLEATCYASEQNPQSRNPVTLPSHF
jgi:hypothetical protein